MGDLVIVLTWRTDCVCLNSVQMFGRVDLTLTAAPTYVRPWQCGFSACIFLMLPDKVVKLHT